MGVFFNFMLTERDNCGIIRIVEKRKREPMKKLMYRKRCKECKREMLTENSKEEMCWECKQEFKRKWRVSSRGEEE